MENFKLINYNNIVSYLLCIPIVEFMIFINEYTIIVVVKMIKK